MQRPTPGVVGVECDQNPMPRWHHDDVRTAPENSWSLMPNLKLVPVEVHGMWHRRLIDEKQLDALALRHGERQRLLSPDDVVD